MTATTAIALPKRAGVRPSGKALLSQALPPIVVGVLALVLWEGLVRALNVQAYLLPAPSAIGEAIGANLATILSAAQVTTAAVLGGMALGSVTGVVAAFVVSLFERAANTILVLVAILSCAPVVALAPIFNQWFGASNLMSKIAVAAIMVFFPVMVNTTRGLLRVDPLHRELMQSLSASSLQLMLFVRIPGALPSLFDGLKIGATLSVIGIIVAEYFGGTANALGVLIANTAALSRFEQTWAAVAAASLLGLAVYAFVLLLERVAMPWHHAMNRT
ncbi:ABC transporter permease [Agrococcus carbonis]|uniref:NitT/TauT family transport system permease protein n=1 Tax=Agrococcus carbonis TaxID=684552 RepID=A0A1H1NJ92_9MICO|nr:ABC transporter permease [Agrococcus carbonis]SDR99076.1 NitT/TauT family transport system permease protein [Agrococcus carbonis]